MDLVAIIVPIVGVILFPMLIILYAKCRSKRQQDQAKARGGDVEIGNGVRDGNMVVLAGAGEGAAVIGGAAAATAVSNGTDHKDKGGGWGAANGINTSSDGGVYQGCCCCDGDGDGDCGDGGGCGGCGGCGG
ncbi:hypothetical protein P3L10_021750 [Capsicum annuum]